MHETGKGYDRQLYVQYHPAAQLGVDLIRIIHLNLLNFKAVGLVR